MQIAQLLAGFMLFLASIDPATSQVSSCGPYSIEYNLPTGINVIVDQKVNLPDEKTYDFLFINQAGESAEVVIIEYNNRRDASVAAITADIMKCLRDDYDVIDPIAFEELMISQNYAMKGSGYDSLHRYYCVALSWLDRTNLEGRYFGNTSCYVWSCFSPQITERLLNLRVTRAGHR